MQEVEVEKKFLVHGRDWEGQGTREYINQGFLNTDKARTVRIRIEGDKAFFTLKGVSTGDTQAEFETEIPMEFSRAILEHPEGLCVGYPIEKYRTTMVIDGQQWEVDEFLGYNAGLIVAEAEYKGPGAGKAAWEKKLHVMKPAWVGDNITTIWRYRNNNLAEYPYKSWSTQEKTELANLNENS